ncbi:MAG: hypothetical protein A2X86_19000 [Bdellovibrionales bacterium GWA2_49_15]|nr:MAG: hypothetical protein A2X86_19000 [Bdellovibrionales bacterium GWA2_49_15]HAZ14315.1 hypothetical protein [Bdellovibrionales bacterium]
MKQIFCLAFALQCLVFLSCKEQLPAGLTGINPTTGIPYSTTDTVEALAGGRSQYEGSMSRWRDRVASSPSSAVEAYPSGPCIRPNAGFSATQLAQEFMSKSKRYRESLGGRGCQCVPMGDLCMPNICNCSEICPNDHGIFQAQASQMMPTDENQLSFVNRNDTTAFAAYPNTGGGYCAGMQLQRRKFASMARFRPNLQSSPALTVPSAAYTSYIKIQIDRMMAGQDPNFLGARNLEELRGKDPEIDRYFREKTGAPALTDPVIHSDGERYHPPAGSVPVTLHFNEPTSTNIPAHTAQDTDIDPKTGTAYGPIPMAGTTEFVNYLAKKVERVAQGFPATLPGYSNLHSLSQHPTYKEIIGRYSAIDWQQVNALDERYGAGTPPFYSTDRSTRSFRPMETSESEALLSGLEDRLPSYPGSGSGPWNGSGPWQSVSLELRGSFNPALGTGSGNGDFYHSVEAYALERLPGGEVHVCIGDPNLWPGSNGHCQNYMTIPAKGSGGQRAGMSYNSSGFAPRVLGKVGIEPSSDHYQGLMTTRMVEYCRTVNRGKFNVQDCGGAP